MKVISVAIFSFLLLTGLDLMSQTNRQYETNPDRKRANIWYFGQNAGIDFNTNPPAALTDGKINTWEGCSSICDTSGNILFYTDGQTVWNKNHDTMENGFNLMGHQSSTQSAIILHHVENDSLYYIITTPQAFNYSIGMRICVVNIYSNNGLGQVISKNKLLFYNSSEKTNAIYHSNNKDIWIVGHEFNTSNFYFFLLSKDGLNRCPIIQSIGSSLGPSEFTNQGPIKFSPDGKYLVISHWQNNKCELYRFDNTNGLISNLSTISTYYANGLEFDNSSKYLYISQRDSSVIQYRISDGKKVFLYKNTNYKLSSLQISNINKIYVNVNDSPFLSSISRIETDTPLFELKDIHLLRNNYIGSCNFNQSYFHTPSIDFAYDLDCIGNSANFQGRDTFYADVHQWVIGKLGKPVEASYNTKSISYIFKDTGNYQITYIASKGSRSDTIIKMINIYPKLSRDFLGKDTAYETGSSFSKTFTAALGMHCYFWYNDSSTFSSFTTDTTGTFVCKVTTKSFCTVTDTVKISSCINNLSVPTISRSRDTIYVSSGDADSFVWYRNGLQYKSGKERFLAMTDTGYYTVEAIKPGHCNRSSQTYHVQKLGVEEHLIQGIRVFPNPANYWISLEFKNTDTYTIIIYDAIGKEVYTTITNNDINIKLDGLSNGVYLFQITNTNNQQFITKILKE
jgi:hypothetical protein